MDANDIERQVDEEIHNEESSCQDRNLMINVCITSQTARHFREMMQDEVDDTTNKLILTEKLTKNLIKL